MALAHAVHPDQPALRLKRERIACGIDDLDLDAVVTGAGMMEKSCRVAGATRVVAPIADDMRLMAALVLQLRYRRYSLHVDITDDMLSVASEPVFTDPVTIWLKGETRRLAPGETVQITLAKNRLRTTRDAGVEGLMAIDGALPEIAKLLVVPLDEIAVIDDGDNVIAMFERSGLSISMDNASPQVRQGVINVGVSGLEWRKGSTTCDCLGIRY